MTRTLAKEWGRYLVNVNAVAFGLIATRLTTAGTGEAYWIDVDGPVYLLCTPDSDDITGQIVVCRGGCSFR